MYLPPSAALPLCGVLCTYGDAPGVALAVFCDWFPDVEAAGRAAAVAVCCPFAEDEAGRAALGEATAPAVEAAGRAAAGSAEAARGVPVAADDRAFAGVI